MELRGEGFENQENSGSTVGQNDEESIGDFTRGTTYDSNMIELSLVCTEENERKTVSALSPKNMKPLLGCNGVVEHVDQQLTVSDNDTTVYREDLKYSTEVDIEQLPDCNQVFDYQFDASPRLLVETKNYNQENYYRGCKWSPDGTCVLTCTNDNFLSLFNMPEELYSSIPESFLPDMSPVLSVNEGELIYDFCWFPKMSSYDISTCCFASCSRGSPIHLFDAYDGAIRCSYVAFNHLDEVVSPYSLCFSQDGVKLYSGYQNLIKIFDTGRPGQQCETRSIFSKSNHINIPRGIISCIAVNPVLIGNYVVGSYSGAVTFLAESVKGPICSLLLSKCGVSHIVYSQCGNYIYIGERKNCYITLIDIRNPRTELDHFQRTVTTNQRVYFDISKNDKWLVTGSTDGLVKFFDLSQNNSSTYYEYLAHGDVVNGCSLHPLLPILATSSGQWKSIPFDNEIAETFDNSFRLWSLLGKSSYNIS